MRKFLLIFLFLGFCLSTPADAPPEIRAVYVATFELNTQTRCNQIIANVLANNINQVYIQVRARADSYYFPNREDATYPNNEPRGQLYSITPSDLDILQYFIDRLHNANPRVEVHAWLTTYNSWNRSSPPSSSNHIYNTHPQWITENKAGVTYTWENDAPLDPGIPAVQDYLYNVFLDVVRNYDIDGIHFDYVRLITADSGYDPVAKARFLADTGWNLDTQNANGELNQVYNAWRRDQIAKLVQRIQSQTQLEKPWVDVSAFIVNYTNSIQNLGQGYNWWVAHGAIDTLHLSVYYDTLSGSLSRWNTSTGRIAPGNLYTRPLVAAVGDWMLEGPDPNYTHQVINSLRSHSRPPDGYNLFRYGSMFNWTWTPPDRTAQFLFGSGGPWAEWAPVPVAAHKVALGQESIAPNPPAGLSVALVSGIPRITFNRPAAASDGDLPVHYRLYRGAATPVPLYYQNMVMQWWDEDSSRSSFSYDDVTAPAGGTYYAAVAYDNWNNQAVSTSSQVIVPPIEIIIESRTPAGTITPVAQGYSQSGSWFSGGSTVKSTAPGLVGVGSEFSTNTTLDASYTFTPNIQVAGLYDIYITTPSAGSVNAANSRFSINHVGGPTTGTIALTSANTGNKWTLMASNIQFAAGTSGSVTISENAPQGDRFYSDAIRFVPAGLTPTPKESKPQVSQPASTVTEVIVDSEPLALNYDDQGSWASTSFSPSGTLYNGSARYFPAGSYPMRDYAIWVIDLPRAGNWAIDGWVRSEQTSLARGAQYRFVDGTGTVRSVIATQRTGSAGWTITVDGVSDDNAYFFNAGRVYVTLYGNTTGNEMILADALRFRLIESSEVGNWQAY